MLRWILAAALCVPSLSLARANSTAHLRRIKGDLIVAPVWVNGKGPFDFVIDTGTNTTLVDPELVAQTGLEPAGTKLLTALTGRTVVPRYVVERLQIGSESYARVEALAQPMTALHNLDSRVHGILGFDVLRRSPFRLDYAHKEIDVYDTEESPSIVGGTRVPVEVRDDRILVRLVADDAPPQGWRLALDSGAPQVILFRDRLGPSLLGRSGESRSDGSTQVETNSSERSAAVLTLNSVVIGGMLFQHVPVVILSSEMSRQSSVEDGLLPSAMFSAVLFDPVTSSLVLNPVLANPQTPRKCIREGD